MKFRKFRKQDSILKLGSVVLITDKERKSTKGLVLGLIVEILTPRTYLVEYSKKEAKINPTTFEIVTPAKKHRVKRAAQSLVFITDKETCENENLEYFHTEDDEETINDTDDNTVDENNDIIVGGEMSDTPSDNLDDIVGDEMVHDPSDDIENVNEIEDIHDVTPDVHDEKEETEEDEIVDAPLQIIDPYIHHHNNHRVKVSVQNKMKKGFNITDRKSKGK